MRFILILFAMLSVSFHASAQSTWDDLIRDVQTPVNAKPSPAPRPGPDQSIGSSDQHFQNHSDEKASEQPDNSIGMKMVLTSRCENPDFPECLWEMRRDVEGVDLKNCKEVTKLYISALASYSKCIDRRAKKQAKNIVEYYNCYAKDGKNCPRLFAK